MINTPSLQVVVDGWEKEVGRKQKTESNVRSRSSIGVDIVKKGVAIFIILERVRSSKKMKKKCGLFFLIFQSERKLNGLLLQSKKHRKRCLNNSCLNLCFIMKV